MYHHRVYAKIDLSAIAKNIDGVRSRIPEGTMIMAVIKADAYGHGAVTVAKELCDRADRFGVSNILEAVELRRAGITNPILVLGYVDPEEYSTAVENDITLTVFDYADAEKLSRVATDCGKLADIHIKADTGMSRIGYRVSEKNADEAARIAALPGICAEGLFTHLARADECNKESAEGQISAFGRFDKMLRDRGVSIPVRHVENSAAIMEMDHPYEMVRMGIMLYGLYPSDETDRAYKLHPAMELISRVSMVKTLEKGEGVSYGHTYTAPRQIKLATVPVGYADGYPRVLSNKSSVIIGGKKCPVVGRVCMDQLMADVTGVENVFVGDRVVLLGEDGGETVSADELAGCAGTVNYELVCGVSRRVPRIYFRDGEKIQTVSYI